MSFKSSSVNKNCEVSSMNSSGKSARKSLGGVRVTFGRTTSSQEYNLQPVSYTSHVYTWRRDKFEPPPGNGLEFWQGNNEQGEGIFSSAISKHNPKKHDVFRSVVAIDCTVHFHFKIDNKDRTKIFRKKQIPTEFTLKNGCLKYYDFRLHL